WDSHQPRTVPATHVDAHDENVFSSVAGQPLLDMFSQLGFRSVLLDYLLTLFVLY
ncbi:hypothetical protein CSUI_008072, partial [Cystoisospora suis]